MRRLHLAVVAALVAGLIATVAGAALAGDYTEAPTAQTQSDYYVVTFNGPPAASYTGGIAGLERTKPNPGEKLDPKGKAVRAYVDHLKGVHGQYRDWLRGKAPKAAVIDEYVLTGNALAIQLNGSSASTLSGGPGVRTATASALYRPTMNVSTGLINATTLWGPSPNGRKNAGSGIKAGIIDTGIVETHRFFACKSSIPHKVYASGVAGFGPDIVFDHGTHVSGTVAGCVIKLAKSETISGEISGVAPGATLADYNVFPGFGAGFVAFGGSAFSHDIAEALEDTVEDGMDVVNMSLGGGVQGPHDFLAEAVNATNDAGVVVAVAAGNDGPGRGTISSPGSADGALTAGASTNPHFIGIPVRGTKDAGGSFDIGAAVGNFNGYDPPVSAAYTVTTPANGCTAITSSVTGKIAVINRGVCTFSTKIRNAQAAGAVGVLVVNNVAGDPVAMAHDGLAFPTIPAAMLGLSDGNSIKPSGTATVDGTSPQEFITANADIIAGFSSRGPTPFTFTIKPDATAPGVNVYSSVFDNAFAMFQGTSMATPHLAGVSALLLANHPSWSPEDVKSAIVNTAKRPVTSHVNGTTPVGALHRGGGRVDAAAANATSLTLDPASVSFGQFLGNAPISGTVSVTVKNVSSTSQLCGVAVTGPAGSGVSVSPTSFSLAAGATTTLTVSLNLGQGAAPGDREGDITLCGLKAPWWYTVG